MEQARAPALFALEQEIKLSINERLFAGGFISSAVYEKAKVLLVKEQHRQCGYIEERVS